MSPVKGEDPWQDTTLHLAKAQTRVSVPHSLSPASAFARISAGFMWHRHSCLCWVRLGTAKKTTRCFVDFLTNCEPSSRGDDGGGRRQRASAQSTDNRQRARSAHFT